MRSPLNHLLGFKATVPLDTAPQMAFLVRSSASAFALCQKEDKPSRKTVSARCAST
jgi:hypothetical protein